MADFEYPGNWETVPTESDSDTPGTIFVTGRTDVEKFRNNPRYSIRIDVTFAYGPESMPDNETAAIINDVTDRLVETFRRDPVAVLTGIYTGCGERNWIFYTTSTYIFQWKFNEALASLPLLPISIVAENDPDWEEYAEMLSVFE